MELEIDYKLHGDISSLVKQVRPQIIARLEALVQSAVDAYLQDLTRHMGGIIGSGPYQDGKVSWDALEETQLKEAPRFWVESGKARSSVTVNIKVSDTEINAFVGISEGAEGYEEVLWNELGFTPENGDKLIRRPLFIPLAETHKVELQNKINNQIRGSKISIRI